MAKCLLTNSCPLDKFQIMSKKSIFQKMNPFSELNQVTGEPLTLTITADAPKNRSKTRRRSKKGKKSKSKPVIAAEEDEIQVKLNF